MTPSRTTPEISDHQPCCCASDDVGGQTTGDLTAALIKRSVQNAQEADLYFYPENTGVYNGGEAKAHPFRGRMKPTTGDLSTLVATTGVGCLRNISR